VPKGEIAMAKSILASRLDLPFYFRLPSSAFLTWDPDYGVAAILPCQHFGQVSFSRKASLFKADQLLDSPYAGLTNPSNEKVMMTCETKKHGEIATLHIDTGPTGGFSELRAYTEVIIFIIAGEETNTLTPSMKTRTFDVLNHFIDIYRLVTQDPYVYRTNEQFDTYLIDFAFGPIPPKLESYSSAEILRDVGEVPFPTAIGKGRQLQYRLNTLEDLFPGPILERPFLEVFQKLIKNPYETPLHYELILTAQVELKQRNYHVAILEAETAFEVYVANVLVELSAALGFAKNQVIAELENPKKLGLLSKRLNRLDALVLK
jgi:hypothetical protein